MQRRPKLPSSASRVDQALAARGLEDRVRVLSASTRTATDAAKAVGCELGQIVKSLVFRGIRTGQAFLILVAGDHRLDEGWMERYTGEPLARADPEFVRSAAGYAIGGVPPLGHPTPVPTYIDYDLLEYPEVWAAAGTPNALCQLTSRELLSGSGGRPVPVAPLVPEASEDRAWITFDCYGTLVDWRSGFFGYLAERGWNGSPSEQSRLFRAYLREEQALEASSYRPYRDVMMEALERAAFSEQVALPAGSAWELPESLPAWPLFPDTRKALANFHRQGMQVAVLSNIDRDLLGQTLSRHRLSVDLVITAEDVRAYKPALAHWIRFLKRTGCSPAEVLHVAGSYEYDIEPARALGFRTAYVERYEPPPEGTDVGTTLPSLTHVRP